MHSTSSQVTKHVLILGGGFAGLACAKGLRDERFEVTLVDRWNHHLFRSLLYQVATAGLAMTEIAQPLRSILSEHKNVTTLMDEVTRIDLEARQVHLKGRVMSYDHLVIALGAKTGYFGHHEWAQCGGGEFCGHAGARFHRVADVALRASALPHGHAQPRLRLPALGGPTSPSSAARGSFSREVLKEEFQLEN